MAKLSGREVLIVENTDKSFPELYARIEKTLEFLRESKPETFQAPEDTYQLQVGPKESTFVAADSVQRCKCIASSLLSLARMCHRAFDHTKC